jgi:hypothetical protein
MHGYSEPYGKMARYLGSERRIEDLRRKRWCGEKYSEEVAAGCGFVFFLDSYECASVS